MGAFFGKLSNYSRTMKFHWEISLHYSHWDGAPAIVGKKKLVAALLKKECPNIITFHCIIHNSVLCSKLNAEFNTAVDRLIHVVNILRSYSTKQHRELVLGTHGWCKWRLCQINHATMALMLWCCSRWLDLMNVRNWRNKATDQLPPSIDNLNWCVCQVHRTIITTYSEWLHWWTQGVLDITKSLKLFDKLACLKLPWKQRLW